MNLVTNDEQVLTVHPRAVLKMRDKLSALPEVHQHIGWSRSVSERAALPEGPYAVAQESRESDITLRLAYAMAWYVDRDRDTGESALTEHLTRLLSL